MGCACIVFLESQIGGRNPIAPMGRIRYWFLRDLVLSILSSVGLKVERKCQ